MRQLDDTPSSLPPPARRRRASSEPASGDRRAALARAIPRRAAVSWWLGLVLALGFAALVTPTITAERWLLGFAAGTVVEHRAAPFTVRAPMLAGYATIRIGGGVIVARGEIATADEAQLADAIAGALPRGPRVHAAVFALVFVLAVMFSHHLRRSIKGRLVRVQIVSLAGIAVLAVAVKLALLSTAVSALVVPVAALAIVPTLALDRTVGLATGVLAALVVGLVAPFDLGLAIVLVVQAATAGLVISERRDRRWAAVLAAGLAATLCAAASCLLVAYLATRHGPGVRDPLHAAWLAAAIGPVLAAILSVPVLPVYQRLVGEITHGGLVALEDLGHPLLRQIADRSPGTWQHSLMMANMAEIAANAIGANGRLVRVGAYFHDLGKSLAAKYFPENLEAGETSPHDRLPPEVSCDAIFAHVTEGIVAARKARLHERVVDFLHMHHGDGVLEYFWARCRDQGNPNGFTIDRFRYPGHPPQSRETAILTICDAVEAAARTLHKPDAAAIDAVVQRIVYGKLHLGQLDDSGLSMRDLRRISDSLRETIRHANQVPGESAAAVDLAGHAYTATAPRLDSLDRKPARDTPVRPSPAEISPTETDAAFASTADVKQATRRERARTAAAIDREDAVIAPADRPAAITPAGLARAGAGDAPRGEVREAPATVAADTVALTREPRGATAAREPAPPVALEADPSPEREPSGHSAVLPVPSDPAQLAAALADIVARVSAAPFGPADAAELLARTAARYPEVTDERPSAPRAASASRSPSRDAATPTPRPRASGLIEDDRRPRAAETSRGHGEPQGGATRREPSATGSGPVALDESRVIQPRTSTRPRGEPRRTTRERPAVTAADDDAGATDPSLSSLSSLRPLPPLPAVPTLETRDDRIDPPSPWSSPTGESPWSTGLASRIDASIDADEWSKETPIVAPPEAELRALLGRPDPTRQQAVDEIALLQRQAAALAGDPPRRSPHPTAEVDPDDIEAAIEVAPPARRPSYANVIGAAKPKKSPSKAE